MTRRCLLLLSISAAALLSSALVRAEEVAPITKEFSVELEKGLPPMQATLLWKDSALQGIEIRAKAGGPVQQRIKIGENQVVKCDLDQEDLPSSRWVGTLDYNGDGFQDIYLQVAKGSDVPFAILLYDTKTKQFVASKSLVEVRRLDVSSGASADAAQGPARKLADSFGLVTKENMKPCKLSISGPPLKKGDYVTVIRLTEKQTVYDAEIDQPVEGGDEEKGSTAYTLKCTPEPSAEEAFVGTAVIGPINGVTIDKSNVASTRLANGPEGKRLFFRGCTSGEGMHLTVWSGKPLGGTRVWHRYHYLGYDVEADCTAKDTAADRE